MTLTLAIFCALLATTLVSVSTAGATNEFLSHGYKSCGDFPTGGHGPLRLYAKHVKCKRALAVQRAYETGAGIYERRTNEYCLKGFPGWCCIGGGGAVTCRRHHSFALAVTPQIDKR
jgi:hypothetical protein